MILVEVLLDRGTRDLRAPAPERVEQLPVMRHEHLPRALVLVVDVGEQHEVVAHLGRDPGVELVDPPTPEQ